MRSAENKWIVLPLILALCSCLLLEASSQFPVSAELAGQRFETTVDSSLAAYYLEHYVSGNRSNTDYDALLDREIKALNGQPLDADLLGALSRRCSTDLATAYFIARLYESARNRQAQDSFHAWVSRLKASGRRPADGVPWDYKSYLLVFVPGYAYRMDPTTGADFARQRKLMTEEGFRTSFVETDELGTVEDNAKIVGQEITRLAAQENKIILISASKAGPEVAQALGEVIQAEAASHVRGWISVGGLLRGSPYADQALIWPKRWFARIVFAIKGLHPSVIRDLSTQVRRPAFARVRLPAGILMLQYIGVPFSGQVPKATRNRYEALRSLGPNDGLTLLADELVPGGIAVTDVGLDHYYRDPEIDLKTAALALVVLDMLGNI